MKSIWILAAAETAQDSQEGTVVTSEPTSEQQAVTQADGSNGKTGNDSTQDTQKQGSPLGLWILPLIVIMMVMMFLGPRKKQQQHQKMVASLKKNDRVRTIGGIFGTVLEIKSDEIILKIDESNNTKMRVVPSAIATVLSDEK